MICHLAELTLNRRTIRFDKGKLKPEEQEKQKSALQQRLILWSTSQAYFMPCAVAHRQFSANSAPSFPNTSSASATSSDDPCDTLEEEDSSRGGSSPFAGDSPESINLLLPSDPISLSHKFADDDLLKKEAKVRVARLEAHLSELRRLLRIRTSVFLDKKAHSVGQKSGTRSAGLLSSYSKKIEDVYKHYEEERKAAVRCDPDGSWRARLKELKRVDVRAAHENANEAAAAALMPASVATGRAPGEAQREISWIWKVPLAGRIPSDGDNTATEAEVDEGIMPFFSAITARDSHLLLALQVE